eukprot:jgi/Chrzof1/4415/Cz14g12090.t1
MEGETKITADLKARAVAAAAAAVANATPGQRDKAIQQAILASQQQAVAARTDGAGSSDSDVSSTTETDDTPVRPLAAPGTYEPPSWAGVPEGVPYSLEILKTGESLGVKQIAAKDHYTFGRSPTADFTLEHPTSSRLHAVLQYNGSTKEAFVYDCGSTHGTFINKNKLKPGVHVPVRVGDIIRFGQSSRMYVLSGPSDLMPEEGLSRLQRRQLALLEAAQRQKEKDTQIAKIQMEAAISTGGCTWGMLEDAEEVAGSSMEVDWRKHTLKNKLTEKQEKLVDKIRKREYKINNLRTEMDRISAKEKSEGGLTAGQASTMVRNEKAIEALTEEIEELDEQVNDSIRDSLSDKQKSQTSQQATTKRKRQADSDDEYDGSDSEDEFYDRTVAGGGAAGAAGSGKAAKKAAVAGKKGVQPAAVVESAETLHGKREALLDDKKQLQEAIMAEEMRLQEAQLQPPPGNSTMAAVADPGEAAAASGAPTSSTTDDVDGDGVDSLDAFMSNVETQMEVDKVCRELLLHVCLGGGQHILECLCSLVRAQSSSTTASSLVVELAVGEDDARSSKRLQLLYGLYAVDDLYVLRVRCIEQSRFGGTGI